MSSVLTQVLRSVRPEILALKAYESARNLCLRTCVLASTQANTQPSSPQGELFLDANESPDAPGFSKMSLNRYPEPQPQALVERLAGLYGVSPQQLLVGRGSDEAIDLLLRTFCVPGQDQILICPPTYGMYEVSAKIQGAGVVSVPLLLGSESCALDESGIEQALSQSGEKLKLVFICNPSNPTGTAFSRESLTRICEMTQGRCVLVFDEAYAEFSFSMSAELSKYAHLIILRTLSKAWSLAGVRCGAALGHEAVIQILQKVRAPYPLSVPAIDVALQGTDPERQALLRQRVVRLNQERDQMRDMLKSFGGIQEVYKSSTNFILVRFKPGNIANRVFEALKAQGIVLRNRSSDLGLQDCVRITVGNESENNRLMIALEAALKKEFL